MQASQSPTLVPLAFAANGTKNTIPEGSQITITPGAASLNDGFPPITMTPLAAGGQPPAGADFNGILNLITQSIRWAHAGGQYVWNSGFTTDANVAGYPQGAQLMRADYTGFWINTVDGNETNPDATDGSAANWVPGYNYGVTSISGLTNASVTLAPLQAAKYKILLAGALTGNINIIFPAWTKEWEVVNNTTGAFTVTAKTAAGTGIVLATGRQRVTGDGTNIIQPSDNIPTPATGDNSQKAINSAFLQNSVLGGATQSWQNVAGSRASGTTYYNTTGRPIFVSIGTTSGGNPSVLPIVSGVPLGQASFANSGTYNLSSTFAMSFVVPPGASYSASVVPGIGYWAELR